jgi:HSP20 family molecular chaperone IbpA
MATIFPILHLLADLSAPAPRPAPCGSPASARAHARTGSCRVPLRTFQPRFDVHETSTAFHLTGELPGVAQSALSLEFADANTLVIRGRRERNATTTAAAAAPKAEGAATAATPAGQDAPRDEPEPAPASHQPTVEDEEDEYVDAGAEENNDAASPATVVSTPAAATAAAGTPPMTTTTTTAAAATATATAAAPSAGGKYLLVERDAGAFRRVFVFPGRIARDGVRAELRDGVLRVEVPKRGPAEPVVVRVL